METPQRYLSVHMLLLATSAGAMTTSTMADTFGTGVNTFTMDFVTIGDPGNAPDTTGYGAVPYTYQMGTYEVSRDMITKANNAGNLDIQMVDWLHDGTQPASGPTWYEAAKFINWLNTSTGHAPAYNFDRNGNFTLWSTGEAWQQGGENLFRNKDTHYFLPSENEWYKAAYFNGTRYFEYSTGSDTAPIPVLNGTIPGTAVYKQDPATTRPAPITNAGGLSPYGTMAQGGNIAEWQESAFDGVNDLPNDERSIRGGFWLTPLGFGGDVLAASNREFRSGPDGVWGSVGIRVAAVPEPEEYAAAFGIALLGTGVWLRRKTVQGVAVK